ncbi:MAG: ligand-binding sensor domain-containing protein, partial [Chitinophagaceae bacterium]
MKRKFFSIRYALLLLTILIGRISFAQLTIINKAQEKYRAVKWGLNEGLSQGSAHFMLKDVNGFLWIGTQGELSRFDGSVFKNYYYDPNKSGTINAKNTGGGMVEDSLHNIWIGTDKGVYRYDIKADTFTLFLPATPYTAVFAATRDEVFCVESDSIITTYNIHSFAKKILVTLTSADSAGFATSYSFFDVRSNSIWMLRGYSGSYGGPPGGGLLQISLSAGKKKYYDWQCYKNIPGHNHGAEGMRYDRKRNCLWINSWEGLMQFTLADKQFHYIGARNSFFDAKDYGHWVGISLDTQNRVWLATKPKGIVIYDPSDHSVTFPFAEDTTLQKEISDYNASIYCDRDGIIWSGFWLRKGIYQLLPYSQVVKHYTANPKQAHSLSSNTVNRVVSAGHEKIWMGTQGGGLNIFDAQTGLFQVLHEKDLPGIKMKNLIAPIGIDTITQKAWLGTDEGFFETDMLTKKSNQVTYRNQDNQIIPVLNRTIAKSYKKEVILTGSYGNQQGIFILNTDSNIAHQVLSFPDNTFYPFLAIAAGGRLIFLKGRNDPVDNQTYTNSNGKWVQTSTPIDSIEWSGIGYDEKDSTYWVAGERQLFHFDKDFRIIRLYTHENGLPEFTIGSMIPDNKGNIWFNTDRSLHQLNIKTGVITTLSEKDGFEKQDFSTGTLAEKDGYGNIYFPGGIHGVGFNQINPDKFISPSSSMYLQSLEINQKPFPLSTGVNNLQELSLKYFQNKITIETGIIDYYSKGSSHIRYKLEGLNDNWQYGPANYTIRYDALPPAKYKLVMQASNAANEFNGPMKSLLIQISPPFWNTWWFISLVVIFIVLAINALVQFRLKQKLKVFNIRQKLHRDLHDDVGATLSSIKVYSEILQTNSQNLLITELINDNAVEMIDRLEIISWATNPKNDSFRSLKDLMKKYASSIC